MFARSADHKVLSGLAVEIQSVTAAPKRSSARRAPGTPLHPSCNVRLPVVA